MTRAADSKKIAPHHKDRLIEELLEQDRKRFQRLFEFISRGVKIIDPFTTYIAENVKIDKGTIIYPLTVIEDDVRIGKNCEIGPFARIRSGTRLKDKAQIGNFVEVVRSSIGGNSKAKHLSYLGDVKIGENVNIGAGTIIANYDGQRKHQTEIGNEVFIGSGTILIAPLKIGRKAVTGAGAVVTKGKNIPEGAVVIGVPARILKSQGHKVTKSQITR